ncbi:MAG TPA: hypothetical protein V6C97_33745 [Oculatellaceae cyanobacterium]
MSKVERNFGFLLSSRDEDEDDCDSQPDQIAVDCAAEPRIPATEAGEEERGNKADERTLNAPHSSRSKVPNAVRFGNQYPHHGRGYEFEY